MFNLRFIKPGLGEIQIDTFKETFECDHRYWSMNKYKEQWEEAKTKIIKKQPAMFITSILNPRFSSFARVWICYPIGDELVFQEQLLFYNQLNSPFDIGNPHKHISSYESVTEDGERISEWRTSAATE